jgi:hypothetical protein
VVAVVAVISVAPVALVLMFLMARGYSIHLTLKREGRRRKE